MLAALAGQTTSTAPKDYIEGLFDNSILIFLLLILISDKDEITFDLNFL